MTGSSPQLEPAVDLRALADWMDREGLPGGPITGVERLAGGTQNILIRFTRGGRCYVFRRGPEHLRPRSNDVIAREALVLAALEGTDVPHPRLIAACTDESVLGGAVFYLMEPVEGFNATVAMPALHASDAGIRHAMGLSAAEALARLGAVDHVAVGLDDFGRPEGFLERQVGRWMSELDSYSRYDGYPGPDMPGLDRVAEWLDANRPSSFAPGIMHGDYHLANLMYEYDGPAVAAIVDWEMSTIGDPLLDLGWLVAMWPAPDGEGVAAPSAVAALGGLCSGQELVARYAELTSRDLSAIDWYTALACFKCGIVLEGSNARACAGKATREVGDLLHAITLGLFARARTIIGG
ncbi:MAG: phosphotransferase family protein [Acidimicrobiia bacterium]|nr:phosphotransferase family protein [Acidimicrobiia bacterium]